MSSPCSARATTRACLYDAYREGYAATHNGAVPGPDRFAYLALFATAHNEAEARRRGELVADYLRTGAQCVSAVQEPARLSLGRRQRAADARLHVPERSFTKDGRVIDMRTGSVQDLIDSVLMFCGTPDQCYRQIVDFIDYTGGLGNLLVHGAGRPPRPRGHGRQPHAAGEGNHAAAARSTSSRLAAETAAA